MASSGEGDIEPWLFFWVLHVLTHQCVHQPGISLNLIVPGILYEFHDMGMIETEIFGQVIALNF